MPGGYIPVPGGYIPVPEGYIPVPGGYIQVPGGYIQEKKLSENSSHYTSAQRRSDQHKL